MIFTIKMLKKKPKKKMDNNKRKTSKRIKINERYLDRERDNVLIH